jgi:hypothetical protein
MKSVAVLGVMNYRRTFTVTGVRVPVSDCIPRTAITPPGVVKEM